MELKLAKWNGNGKCKLLNKILGNEWYKPGMGKM